MNVLMFGATGMIGQGVLRECLRDPRVTRVLTIGRAATGQQHEKLGEIVHANLLDLTAIESHFADQDACFFCLGISSAGMLEADYRRITYDMPLAAARALVARSPSATFVYVSGLGADSTEQGRLMWARVKGQAENALMRLPFKAVYVFRAGFVQPLHGIQSRTAVYNTFYRLAGPLFPLMRAIAPGTVTTTEQIGRAMIAVAERGYPKRILDNRDINHATRL